MRTVLVVGLGLVLLVAASSLAISRLLAREGLQAELVERTEAIIGQGLAIEGDVDLRLLPRPTLSIAGASIDRDRSDDETLTLEVERLDLEVRPLPLMRGEVAIEGVTLVRPRLELIGDAESLPGLPLALPAAAGEPGAVVRRISIREGRALVHGRAGETPVSLDRIGLDVVLQDSGPYAVSGDFVAVDQTFRFTGRVGRFQDQTRSAVQLELAAAEPRDNAVRLSYSGLVEHGGQPRAEGRFALQLADLGTGLALLSQTLGQEPPGAAALLRVPVAAEGDVVVERGEMSLTGLDLRFADLTGRGELELGQQPGRVVADLRFDRLSLDPERLQRARALAEQAVIAPSGLALDLDLALDTLALPGGEVRRLRLMAARAPGGAIEIRSARAALPGAADLSFTGAIARDEGVTRVDGEVAAVADDPREVLAWFGIDATRVPEDKLRQVGVSGTFSGRPGRIALEEAELRFDATTVTGSLAYQATDRGQVAAALSLDRLDLDDYAPDQDAETWLGFLERLAEATDTALDARIGRLTAAGVRWSDVVLDSRLVAGQLELRALTAKGPAATRAELAGTVDVATRSFALDGELEAPRPALFLRQLDIPPPRALARIAPLALEATLTGHRTQMDADLAIGLADLDARLIGEAAFEEGALRAFDFEVQANHPDYATLVRELRAISVVDDPPREAPFTLEGRLRRDDEADLALAGSAALGTSRVTGEFAWQEPAAGALRPRARIRLSSAEPLLANIMPVFALFDLRLDPTLVGSPVVGNWPRLPLQVGWLRSIDGVIELSGKGGLFGDGTEIEATLEDQRLRVERAEANVFGGTLDLEASLDVGRPAPLLALALGLDGVDPREIARSLGLPEILEGEGSFEGEITAIGRTPFDLMRSLIGEARFTLAGGRLLDIPTGPAAQTAVDGGPPLPGPPLDLRLQRLETAVAIERGLATLTAGDLVFEEGEGGLTGLVDLLLWVADLRLTLEGVPAFAVPERVLAVGRLGDPQVRVVEAVEPTPGAPPLSGGPLEQVPPQPAEPSNAQP